MMHRFVIVFLAAFGAASVSFAAPANVVADSAPTVSTHEVPVLSFTGMENPDAYSSSLSISPEARAYLDREAVKEGYIAGTGAEDPDAYASSHSISPEARASLGGVAAAAVAAGQ